MTRFLIFATCLLVALTTFSCSSGRDKEKQTDTVITDSLASAETDEDYSALIFKSPEDVRSFLDFKKFEDDHGYIAFNGKGGVIADEAFNTDSIALKDEKSAEIYISLPKMKMTGKLLLKIEEKKVILEDEDTHSTYRLIEVV